jgi:hypothetical protein
MNLSEDQWNILIQHNVDRQNERHKAQMNYLDYMAVLVSPSPKDTMKAIEARQKAIQALEDVEEGETSDGSQVIIKHELDSTFQNTTFYDQIAAEVSGAEADRVRQFFGDTQKVNPKSVRYIPKPGQMDYFTKAIEAHQKGEELLPTPSIKSQIEQMHLDSLSF